MDTQCLWPLHKSHSMLVWPARPNITVAISRDKKVGLAGQTNSMHALVCGRAHDDQNRIHCGEVDVNERYEFILLAHTGLGNLPVIQHCSFRYCMS